MFLMAFLITTLFSRTKFEFPTLLPDIIAGGIENNTLMS